MKPPQNTHPGKRGKTLVEKIRDALDEAYILWYENKCKHADSTGICDDCIEEMCAQRYAEGIARALGILRSTSEDEEIELAAERYEE